MIPSFSRRMGTVHRSFIREILKVTEQPDVISFAGGLPNPELFPFRETAKAAALVLGAAWGGSPPSPPVLQYSTTEGLLQLRQWIAARYAAKWSMDVDPDCILITTGSQQGLDLIAKVFLDAGDLVVMERPGYLGAIQSFSLFEPRFATVCLQDDGPDMAELERVLDMTANGRPPKLYYSVTNFQNPSGVTMCAEKRTALAERLQTRQTMFVEDDPYGELRFAGTDVPPVYKLMAGRSILLGSFSKIAAPGFRVGWVVAEREIMDKLVIAKQAADLHTSTVAQRILHQYLEEYDIDEHIALIRERYGKQREAMLRAMEQYFPPQVTCTKPEGGMFLWVTLPKGASSMELFDKALECKVAFVPGRPFYVTGPDGEPEGGGDTMRLNFSNTDEARIQEGMKRLGTCIAEMTGS